MKQCLECKQEFVPKESRQRFCSHSCSAKTSNRNRSQNKEFSHSNCLSCDAKIVGKNWRIRKFCSHVCQHTFSNKLKLEDWKRGVVSQQDLPVIVRNYLFQTNNNCCQKCGFSGVNPTSGKPVLQIHHIDGDMRNHKPDNLEVLCLNCHGMTSNFGRLNPAGNGRRLKYGVN